MANSNEQTGRRAVTSLRELQQEIQPPRDLWTDIEARLSQTRGMTTAPRSGHFFSSRAWLRVVALAASVALLAVGIWIGHSTRPSREMTPESTGVGAPSLLQIAHTADPRYLQERSELLRSLPTQLAALPPESQAQVTSSLGAIHKAMRDLEAALGRDSSNALLQELLINTCQDEMRVLTAVREASEAGKRI